MVSPTLTPPGQIVETAEAGSPQGGISVETGGSRQPEASPEGLYEQSGSQSRPVPRRMVRALTVSAVLLGAVLGAPRSDAERLST